jgi:hypothetical protein
MDSATMAVGPPSRETAPAMPAWRVMGYRVLRFTHRQLTREPESVAPILRALVFPPGRQTRA